MACFEHALAALPHLPESHETLEQAIDLRFALRNTLRVLGEDERVFDHLLEAETLAEGLNDPRRQSRVAAFLTIAFTSVGTLDRALAYGQRALTLAESLGDLALRVGAHHRLSQLYYDLGDYHRAIDFCRKNLELLQGDLLHERFGLIGAPSVNSRTYLAWCCAELGTFAEGIATGEEGVRIAARSITRSRLSTPMLDLVLYTFANGIFPKLFPCLNAA